MKKRTNNRGFTLVEMMVVVALLSIVSVLLYQTWCYLYGTHQRAEMLYIQQNAANQVAEWIEDSVNTATEVKILSKKTTIDPDYSYIYSSDPDHYETSQIMYYDATTGTTGTVTDVPLELNFYTVSLDTANPNDTSKAMEFSVAGRQWEFNSGYSATDYAYETSSLVSFPNMARAIEAQKTGTYQVEVSGVEETQDFNTSTATVGGTAIMFKSGVSLMADVDITMDSCFIATAAYGTKNDEMVATLRMFRDEVLLQSDVGSAFVDFYYRVSPPIADSIAQSALARWVVRVLLTPLVVVATLMVEPVFIGLGCATLAWMYLLWRYVYPPNRKRLYP